MGEADHHWTASGRWLGRGSRTLDGRDRRFRVGKMPADHISTLLIPEKNRNFSRLYAEEKHAGEHLKTALSPMF
ncbi:hypothetical protein GCM10018793_69470 [Streptomyces sulfonofaciens]|uniref:Uncharacterized protein n=1 Tax=Streptomyces sulfonofaciens TaxID=68272 RepID=A0A919GRI5_9ACTN|nr:hypothetical protein GCM10018793_69470 [Streptomyces sulfonofaciens]